MGKGKNWTKTNIQEGMNVCMEINVNSIKTMDLGIKIKFRGGIWNIKINIVGGVYMSNALIHLLLTYILILLKEIKEIKE